MDSENNVHTMMEEMSSSAREVSSTARDTVSEATRHAAALTADPIAMATGETLHEDPYYNGDGDGKRLSMEGVGDAVKEAVERAVHAVSDPITLATGSESVRGTRERTVDEAVREDAKAAAEVAQEMLDSAKEKAATVSVTRDDGEQRTTVTATAAQDKKHIGIGAPMRVVPGVTPTKMIDPPYSETVPVKHGVVYESSAMEEGNGTKAATTAAATASLLNADELFGEAFVDMSSQTRPEHEGDREAVKRAMLANSECAGADAREPEGVFERSVLGAAVRPQHSDLIAQVDKHLDTVTEAARGKLSSLDVDDIAQRVHIPQPREMVMPEDRRGESS